MDKILLAEDTLITMADGIQKHIEDIYIGERVSSNDGYAHIVTKLAMAATNKICVLTTEKGKILRFAEGSKIESNDTIVYEKMNLDKNEMLTVDGTEKISDMHTQEYKGRVYAIYLNKDEYIIANDFVLK